VQNSAQAKTRDAVAKEAGVSHDTIAKVKVLLVEAVPACERFFVFDTSPVIARC
jgi:hypothetical protein